MLVKCAFCLFFPDTILVTYGSVQSVLLIYGKNLKDGYSAYALPPVLSRLSCSEASLTLIVLYQFLCPLPWQRVTRSSKSRVRFLANSLLTSFIFDEMSKQFKTNIMKVFKQGEFDNQEK